MARPNEKPVSIVEVEPFKRVVSSVLTEDELEEFKYFIASHPESGDLIRGTGGVRKVRWAPKGIGKSGGVRIIYYFHDLDMPLFLITAYKKSRKVSLTKQQRNQMSTLVDLLVQHYSGERQ